MRVVGQRAGDDVGEQHDLGVGEQHADLGPGQRFVPYLPLRQRHRRRQVFDGAVEQAARLQHGHEARLVCEVGDAAALHHGERQRLLVVVGQHQLAHLVGHLGEQHVAVLAGERAGAHRLRQRDLDVDLDVGRVDAAGIVDGVGVAGAAGEAELDAGALGDAEIGALADHLGANFRGGDADAVVGAVAGVGVGLGGSAHIGADAAEPEQVDGRPEDGAHDLGRRCHRLVETDRRRRFRSQRHRLLRARHDHAAGGELGLVVVLPGRARQGEQPPTLFHRGGRIGVRIDEDVAVVEGGEKARLVREQHAVAEHVARHVADADAGEGRGLDVAVHLAEVPLDRFPGAAGGDAHLLVVVARRTARCEGVVQPEAVRLADRIRGVGEGRGALVGGDDEIGIVGVAAHDVRRRDDRAGIEIVGDGKKAGDEVDIGLPPGLEHGVAAAACRQTLRIEAALGADRHDDGVLDLLRLDQAEYFGAVVLGAVRPPEPTARDRAEA